MSSKLICIAGPTASGKTSFAVHLAKHINGEIISADSMQIYKYMNIGTAKPTEEEKQGIKHYLIDEITPFESFSVNEFVIRAKKYIDEIRNKGKIPIVAGGTGLYINALTDNVKFTETEASPKLREELLKTAEEKGNDYLHNMLEEIDPESARRIHPNNLKRVIRAIEIYKTSGITMSEQNLNSKKEPSPYDLSYLALTAPREYIYKRINKRVDIMLEKGLIEEVEALNKMGLDKTYNSMQGIGYKQTLDYLEGKMSLSELSELIKQESRRYAKRQLTWFRRDERIKWADITICDTNEKLLECFYNEQC